MFLYLLAVGLSLLSGCVTDHSYVPYGVVKEHAAYVPARMAVLPCRFWPSSARFERLPLSNMNTEDLAKVCQKFDEFVLKGFEDQPYMRGYSPTAVSNLLSEQGMDDHVNKIDALWRHVASDCLGCSNAASYYVYSIAERTDWRLWLADLSKGVRFADAVLIPFVLYGSEFRYDDRGIATAKRAIGSALFLIETTSGELIWSAAREASAMNQSLAVNHQLKEIIFPDWPQVYERAFQGDLWADFPGKQEYK